MLSIATATLETVKRNGRCGRGSVSSLDRERLRKKNAKFEITSKSRTALSQIISKNMTRYTDVGRKRTYLQAGFDDSPDQDPTTSANDLQTSQKQRKRTKQAVENNEMNSSSDFKKGQRNVDGKDKMKKSFSKRKLKKDTSVQKTSSEQRRLKRIQEKMADTTCFACREKGHAAKDCPNVGSGDGAGEGTTGKSKNVNVVGLCYRCGSTKHTLSRCKRPEDPRNPLPYASCFVCSERGHLASSCPKNKERGVYPNGGSCKICGETTHLARNCTLRNQVPTDVLLGVGREAGADEDDFHTLKRKTAEVDKEEQQETKSRKKSFKADVKKPVIIGTTSAAPLKKKVVFF